MLLGGGHELLQRTVRRQNTQVGRRRWRPVAIALLPLPCVVLLYLVLPNPGPRIRDLPISDTELYSVVGSLRAPGFSIPLAPGNAHSSSDERAAQLGRKLFQSNDLTPTDNMSCASCHASPAASTSANLTLPQLINLRFAHWFGISGDTDSIGAATLAALENPTHMASSRLFVVRQILGPWRRDYEAVFGNVPAELLGPSELPSAGLPAPPRLQWEINIAAAGLASMGDSHLLDAVISKAIGEHLAPALELSGRAFDQAHPPLGWIAAYEKMSLSQVAAVNQVYVNVGVAIGSYLRGLIAFDSAFDRFADRWRANIPVAAALGDGFTNRELIGLKLFVGPGKCISCHSGPTLSDQQFHNVGLSQLGETIMAGRAVGSVRVLANPFNCIGAFGQKLRREASDCADITTLNTEDVRSLGAFKTPSLRNLAHRQRFMHDQRFNSLETTLGYYNELTERAAIGQRDPLLHPLGFTSEELEALAAFLNSLSSPVRDLNDGVQHSQ